SRSPQQAAGRRATRAGPWARDESNPATGAPLPSAAMTDGNQAANGGNSASGLVGTDGRSNGLAPEAPNPGQLILLAGGAGYIGCILAESLLNRGYEVRILDRMWWGDDPLAHIRDRIEVVTADVRDVPAETFEGVDAV